MWAMSNKILQSLKNMYENKKENRPYTNTIRIQLYTILFNYDLIRPSCEIKLSYPKIVWHSCNSCKFCNKFKQAKNIYA